MQWHTHRQQPTRLPHPWDSPGKNTGVGCHFLLQCMKVESESEDAQSCPTLSDPMDSSPPVSSVHGIFQARVLEWGAIAFSKIKTRSSILEVLFWYWLKVCTLRIGSEILFSLAFALFGVRSVLFYSHCSWLLLQRFFFRVSTHVSWRYLIYHLWNLFCRYGIRKTHL